MKKSTAIILVIAIMGIVGSALFFCQKPGQDEVVKSQEDTLAQDEGHIGDVEDLMEVVEIEIEPEIEIDLEPEMAVAEVEVLTDTSLKFIAHAGGDYKGIARTNSNEALTTSYTEGYGGIEVDINLTSDGVPVCIHDWGNANWLMGIEKSNESMTNDVFEAQDAMFDMSLMTLEDLEIWCGAHPEIRIISDVKSDNIIVLEKISVVYPMLYRALIPQVYDYSEYEVVSGYGYEEIILTLYSMHVEEEVLLEFCQVNQVYAITMNTSHGFSGLPKKLKAIGVKSYVHTVNAYSEYMNLMREDVYGIYTDYLQPVVLIEN